MAATSVSKPVYLQSEPEFKTKTKELENNHYYYGKGMQTKFLESKKKFDEIMKRKEPEPEAEGRDDSEKKSTAGTGMFMGGEVIPSYEEILAAEDSDDDGRHPGYAF